MFKRERNELGYQLLKKDAKISTGKKETPGDMPKAANGFL